MVSDINGIMISIMLGVLAAIVYAMRVLILLERRLERVDVNLCKIANRVLKEELKIEKEEKKIEAKLSKLISSKKKKTKRKSVKKKTTKKRKIRKKKK